MKDILSILLMLFVPGPVHFPAEVTDVLDARNIRYEIVKNIDDKNAVKGFYRFSDGVILFDDSAVSSTFLFSYIAAHEMIHKIRYEKGLWTGNRDLEEAIAIVGADRAARALGLPHIKTDIKRSLGAYGLKLSDFDKAKLEEEIEKTLGEIHE